MKTKLLLVAVVLALFGGQSFAQKKAIDHSVYDSWQSASAASIPYNGEYALYTVRPQDGDLTLYLLNLKSGNKEAIERGTSAVISRDGKHLMYRLVTTHKEKRDVRIKKLKGTDVPKDTLVIRNLETGETQIFPYIKSYRYGSELKNIIAIQEDDKPVKKQEGEKEEGEKEEKKSGNPLLVYNTLTKEIDKIENVDRFTMNSDATLIAYINKPKDDSEKTSLFLYSINDKTSNLIFSVEKGAKIELPVFDKDSRRLAFYAQLDKDKAKKNVEWDIYHYDLRTKSMPICIVSSDSDNIPQGSIIAKKSALRYSDNGAWLSFGTMVRPEEEDTTIADFERVKLDIWTWNADYLPTVANLTKPHERAYTALYYFNDANIIQLADEGFPMISPATDQALDNILAVNNTPYLVQRQWKSDPIQDLYKVNIKTGKRELIKRGMQISGVSRSPKGNYYTWFDSSVGEWFLYEMATGETKNITSDIEDIFHNDRKDTPGVLSPIGSIIWYEDESSLMIDAKYDIWQINPLEIDKPMLLTEGIGNKEETNFNISTSLYFYDNNRSINGLNNERMLQKGYPLYFTTFDSKTKEDGFYIKETKKNSKMKKLVEDRFSFSSLALSYSDYPGLENGKKKKSNISKPIITFIKGNFENPNDVYLTKDFFKTQTQISHINPQQDEYNWGTAELVHWTTEDGIDAEGLLFKPENFDPNKKYPLMIYFYEKDADGLYNYRSPSPSRSTVNIPYFVSNEYIVFNPNIYYTDGEPGESAMRSIMPGVDMLCEFPWIDEDNMAIQGQSWGGYQVAYMITQTDRFKAAGSGAPVSNMTSAYGGLRFGSGMVRQFQYENGQSRIGKDLWTAFDDYYANSPLFFLPNVTTPVLIMHNDADGAVPWSQGVEFFTGLRRLGKEAWMLQYKGEDHNLVQRHNAKDLSIRLEEFFNHFLKGAPMPEWMKK